MFFWKTSLVVSFFVVTLMGSVLAAPITLNKIQNDTGVRLNLDFKVVRISKYHKTLQTEENWGFTHKWAQNQLEVVKGTPYEVCGHPWAGGKEVCCPEKLGRNLKVNVVLKFQRQGDGLVCYVTEVLIK